MESETQILMGEGEDIWDQIISKLDHQDLHLQPLSLVCKLFLSITNRHKQTLKIYEPTAQFLPSLLRRFPNLKHLSLSDYIPDPVPILHQIADFDFRLETLDLSNLHCLPVEGLERLPVSMLSGLKSFKFRLVCDAGREDMEMIANLFPNLEELDLSRSHAWFRQAPNWSLWKSSMEAEDGIVVLASKLNASLRRINLQGNDWVSDGVVISLSQNCPNLEEIVLKECSRVTQAGAGFALQASQKLKTIGLGGGGKEMYEIHQPLSLARSLSEVDFMGMCMSDDMLCAIVEANLPLKRFTMNNCWKFTFAGIESFLEGYSSLDYFALEGVDLLTDDSIRTLAKSLTKARHVKLNHCQELSDSALFTLISQSPSLLETVEMTHVVNMGKEKGFVVYNAPNPRMRTLDLSSNKNLSSESLKKIASACPNLETLKLSSCLNISRKGVGEVLRKCPRLKRLQINGCSGVKNMDLDSDVQLELLEASNSGLNDRTLIKIANKCPNLVLLDLKDCQGITLKGVKEVVDKCAKLKEINLHNCRNVTTSSLHWMVITRPSLRKIIPPPSEDWNYFEEVDLFVRQYGCYMRDDHMYC